MRNSRSVLIVGKVLCVGLLFAFLTSRAGGQTDSVGVWFHWAFVAYPKPESLAVYTPRIIDRDTVLYSGDYFKLFVRPLTECYAYVFWHDSKKELKILFPYTPDQFDTDWEVDKPYHIPKGDDWFQLDEIGGREELHLLVSGERLFELERLVTLFQAAGRDEKDASKLKLLNELRVVKKRFHTRRTFAERPAAIAGTVRSGDEEEPLKIPPLLDISGYAKEIQASTFYSKTLVIKHK